MPAILIELGFLQDEEDNRLLDKYCDDYAAAIADAVQSVAEAEQAGE
jgi:N-acetylmuramoyl-L-alanine amidase